MSDDRGRRLECHARALHALLYEYEPRDRIFALTEITQRVQKTLASRESSRYSVAFDDRDTDPNHSSIGDRVTRRIDSSSLIRQAREDKDDHGKTK